MGYSWSRKIYIYSITKSIYAGEDRIIFVFDLGESKSFKALKIWIEDTKKTSSLIVNLC